MDFAFELGKGVEETTSNGPMVKVRHVFFENSRQFSLSRVFVGLETFIQRIWPVTADTSANHAAYEVAHPDYQRITNGRSVNRSALDTDERASNAHIAHKSIDAMCGTSL